MSGKNGFNSKQPQTAKQETPGEARRRGLSYIAESTLHAIEKGSYLQYDLKASLSTSKQNTKFYSPNSLLSSWASTSQHPTYDSTEVALYEISTLAGARLLANARAAKHHSSPDNAEPATRIGVLNFASAKKPGGGFLTGAQAQEESIARSSTLYPSLMTRVAQEFYTIHNRDPKGGYYSHAMIYSPHVVIMRDDQGVWVEPLTVDVLTSPAVNAGVVKRALESQGKIARELDAQIARVMRERMARILFLFESQGVKDLVLGSFGTGVFRNDVGTVAEIWAELMLKDGARFRRSFEHVIFAVLGRPTFDKFKEVFKPYGL